MTPDNALADDASDSKLWGIGERSPEQYVTKWGESQYARSKRRSGVARHRFTRPFTRRRRVSDQPEWSRRPSQRRAGRMCRDIRRQRRDVALACERADARRAGGR